VPTAAVKAVGVVRPNLVSNDAFAPRLARPNDNDLRGAKPGYGLVTVGGKVLRASKQEEPDLLWALRGGGGNFGIATSLQYELHPARPTVIGGPILMLAIGGGAMPSNQIAHSVVML
jgi:FAD/FMN-containing dehydrogenase